MVRLNSCPICESREAALFASQFGLPVMMHRLYDSRAAAQACERGDLELWQCRACGFVWNRAFDPTIMRYDAIYENDQLYSAHFAAHVGQRARDVIAAAPQGEALDYLEVGCGQGQFLQMVEELAGPRLSSAQGFDPAWRGEDGDKLGRAQVFKTYFNADTARLVTHKPNVVASRHTIEHVPDPVAFLRALRDALGSASNAALLIETPCMDWIIANHAVQDLFYEHCSIFTARALAIAFERAGFSEVAIDHVFDGQYLWGMARAGARTDAPAPPLEAASMSAKTLADFVAHWRRAIDEAAARGRVAIWGAGAKGVTFANLLSRGGEGVDYVIDINPAKQGRYIAGSGLRAISPQEAVANPPKTIFVMNPNYFDEIVALTRGLGLDAELVPIN